MTIFRNWTSWPTHVRWAAGLLLLILLVLWWIAALSFGTTLDKDRDAEIKALGRAVNTLNDATNVAARVRTIIQSGSPGIITDTVAVLERSENDVKTATNELDRTGMTALGGELVIFFGVALQIAVTFAVLYPISEWGLERWRRDWAGKTHIRKKEWQENIHNGQILGNEEDDILRFVRGEEEALEPNKRKRPEYLRERGQAVADEYKDFLLKHARISQEEPPWASLSKLFYKLSVLCRENAKYAKADGQGKKVQQDYETAVRANYKELRTLINRDLADRAVTSILVPSLFTIIFLATSSLWNGWTGPVLGSYLQSWQLPIIVIGLAFVAAGLVHVVLEWGAYWLTEKTWTDLDDVVVGVIIGPLSAVLIAAMSLWAITAKTSLDTPQSDLAPFLVWASHVATAGPLQSLITIVIGMWLAVFFLNRVVVWGLDRWAKKTEQKYDDMFVQVIRVFGSFIIIAFGLGAALAAFNGPIREATGVDSVLIPYSIVVSVFTAILGYASRAGFENFFGGLLLQIEKPFERGERIVLPDGKICDVRDVGMRSTTLYNVLENSEVSVPNSEMAKMTVTNVSRPDLELRVSITVWISPDAKNLRDAEAILLDIAYLEEEVDQMRLFKDELPDAARLRGRVRRSTIEEEFLRLSRSHAKIRGATVYKIVGGGTSDAEGVFERLASPFVSKFPPYPRIEERYQLVLYNNTALRKEYQKVLEEENQTIANAAGINDLKNPILRAIRRALHEVVFSKEYTWDTPDFAALMHRIELREGEELGKYHLKEIMQLMAAAVPEDPMISGTTPKEQIKSFFEMLELKRRGIVLRITEQLATLSDYVFAITEQYPDVRSELDLLISELNKEPVVFSRYTDDGHIEVTLNCYALYLERRFEVTHKLNRDVERRFSQAGIKFVQPPRLQEAVSTLPGRQVKHKRFGTSRGGCLQ